MVKMAGSVNFHVALARGTTADESSGLLRACGSLRCRSGRCLTSGLRSTSVVAGRVPLARSNRPHTLGLSNVQTQGQVNLPLRLPT